jgi:antitoxin (DNA-binding transcriptional repressor) of toxin-antitoxin stability system
MGPAAIYLANSKVLGTMQWCGFVERKAKGRIMGTVPLDDAKAHLPEIISGLTPGEQVVIVQDGEPLAMLTRSQPKQWPCSAGTAKEGRHWMASDFDAPLDDFREYME